jgi:hypothetical protein
MIELQAPDTIASNLLFDFPFHKNICFRGKVNASGKLSTEVRLLSISSGPLQLHLCIVNSDKNKTTKL